MLEEGTALMISYFWSSIEALYRLRSITVLSMYRRFTHVTLDSFASADRSSPKCLSLRLVDSRTCCTSVNARPVNPVWKWELWRFNTSFSRPRLSRWTFPYKSCAPGPSTILSCHSIYLGMTISVALIFIVLTQSSIALQFIISYYLVLLT